MISSRTRTSIANIAALHLGIGQIGDIEEDFGTAVTFRGMYDEAVGLAVSEFDWLAASSRSTLTQISLVDQSVPHMTGFRYAYPYPVDCISPREINDRPVAEIHWQIENLKRIDQFGTVIGKRRVIYCNEPGPLSMRYSSWVEPGDMTPHLALAVGIRLAMLCQGTLVNSTSKAEALRIAYKSVTAGDGAAKGGWQVDSRAQNPKPQIKNNRSRGSDARAGRGL